MLTRDELREILESGDSFLTSDLAKLMYGDMEKTYNRLTGLRDWGALTEETVGGRAHGLEREWTATDKAGGIDRIIMAFFGNRG